MRWNQLSISKWKLFVIQLHLDLSIAIPSMELYDMFVIASQLG